MAGPGRVDDGAGLRAGRHDRGFCMSVQEGKERGMISPWRKGASAVCGRPPRSAVGDRSREQEAGGQPVSHPSGTLQRRGV